MEIGLGDTPGAAPGRHTAALGRLRQHETPGSASGSSGGARVDFELGGLARIRLVEASRDDMGAVARQLGLDALAAGEGPADVVVRFVDSLPAARSARPLGLEDAAFSADAFFLVVRRRGRLFHVQFPFDRLGPGCEIVCERGLGRVPMLVAVLNLTLLAKGVVPLHASAFIHAGLGILATGWSKGGKTETLLAFMARGARYVGDEWVYISDNGARMSGIPIPIRIWDWHLRQAPQLRSRIPWRGRLQLGALRTATALSEALFGSGSLARALAAQLYVELRPAQLFESGRREASARLDQVVFVLSDSAREVRVEAAEPSQVARRMTASFLYEIQHSMGHYLKFRFAFPDTPKPWLDRVQDLYRDRLEAVLAGKPTHALHHPYPAPIPELYRALADRLR